VENVTFGADTLHNMKSVSKSVASLAVGIAIDRRLIASSCRESHFSIGASGFLTFLHDEFY
jgi:hypothetical protein